MVHLINPLLARAQRLKQFQRLTGFGPELRHQLLGLDLKG